MSIRRGLCQRLTAVDRIDKQAGHAPERRNLRVEFTTEAVTEMVAASHRHKPALTSGSFLPGLRAVIIYLARINDLNIGCKRENPVKGSEDL